MQSESKAVLMCRALLGISHGAPSEVNGSPEPAWELT